MEVKEFKVDMRMTTSEEMKEMAKMSRLVFELNNTMPFTERYSNLLKEVFKNKIGIRSTVTTPIQGVHFDKVEIGKNVFINSNTLFMARGGITIKDNVQIAANCQLITNNHDMYERQILLCKPIVIEEGAWIGAGVTIMPGVRIGKHAVVGACSLVTHDVPDYAVVMGSPAKLVKTLDERKFK